MASPDDDKGAKTPTGKVTPPPAAVTAVTVTRGAGGRTPPPPDPPDPPDDGDEGMLRMSFLEHLQELRSRIIKMLAGVLVSVAVSLTFCNQLWRIIAAPAVAALTKLGIKPATLKGITPMEQSGAGRHQTRLLGVSGHGPRVADLAAGSARVRAAVVQVSDAAKRV